MQANSTATAMAGAPATGPVAAPAIRVRDVRHAIGAVDVLDGVSLDVAVGETVALVGPSGCGKSTLLELVCGLQHPSAGTVAAAAAALLPQRDALLPWADALDNAALPLRLAGLRRADARRRAEPLLADLGLRGFEHARPHELSGGMRQRVAVARALAMRPKVLLMDEPFAALDVQTRAKMQDFLLDVSRASGASVLFVTHSIDEAVALADRVVVFTARPGRIKTIVPIALERPRDPFSADCERLRRDLTEALRSEVDRAFAEQEALLAPV